MDRSDTDSSRRFTLSRLSFIHLMVIATSVASMWALPAQAADTVAPSVPGNLVVTVASNTQLNVSWNAATDNVAVTGYLLERCKGAGCTNFAQLVSVTSTTYNNTALTVATSYSYRLRARDAANNQSAYSAVVSAATLPDTQAPTAPTGLGIAVQSATQLSLSWIAATDDIKVVGYLVERCLGAGCTTFSQVAAPSATTYTNTGLVPASSYSYRVRAKDASNNLSAYSPIVSATTLPDTQAPTIPAGLTATISSSTKITLTWTAATDDVKVTSYLIERCTSAACTSFAQIATATGVTYGNTGLLSGTTYRYRIRATDAAGNKSDYSNVATNTTTGTDTSAPTAPTSLTATSASGTQINLSWSASTDNVAVTGYKVERCQGASCTTFTEIATPATPTFTDTGLNASTTYLYRVRATDAANNLSLYYSAATAATQYSGPITFTYSYDQLGRLIHAAGSDGSSIDYQYDANGNVTTISRQ